MALKHWIYNKLREFASKHNPFRKGFESEIFIQDLLNQDFSHISGANLVSKGEIFDTAWIISPPDLASGGHQNAFRHMKILEKVGHKVTVYIYAPWKRSRVSAESITKFLREASSFPDIEAEIRIYDPNVGIQNSHNVVIACDWPTAYAVKRVDVQVKKFYFVQDFEPWFYPQSSEYVLSENTYRMGFWGICAGPWLKFKLARDYGMESSYFSFGVDKTKYFVTNSGPRPEILFYARPPTPRRATEIGLIVLELFHQIRPEVKINIVGWDMSSENLRFPYENHKTLPPHELNDLYNRCSLGLVFSLTNVSLLPMELIAAGVVPVVNDSENTRMCLQNKNIEFVNLDPEELVQKMLEVLDSAKDGKRSTVISGSVHDSETLNNEEMFLNAFQEGMRQK